MRRVLGGESAAPWFMESWKTQTKQMRGTNRNLRPDLQVERARKQIQTLYNYATYNVLFLISDNLRINTEPSTVKICIQGKQILAPAG